MYGRCGITDELDIVLSIYIEMTIFSFYGLVDVYKGIVNGDAMSWMVRIPRMLHHEL